MVSTTLSARLLGIALALATVVGTFASGAAFLATSADADEVSPLLVQSGGPVQSVAMTDGRVHVVYELLLVNHGLMAVAVTSIETLGSDSKVLQTTSTEALHGQSRQSPLGGDGTVLQPSQSSLIFMDVSLAGDAVLPRQISHRFEATLSAPATGDTASFGGLTVEATGVARTISFRTANLEVSEAPAVVLSPPVRGSNWVIFRGCCGLSTSHRGTTSFPDGEITIGERFAIDFVRTNDEGMLITGPGNELASYIQYGAEILAVADGIVVSARNTEPEQVPGASPDGLSDDVAGGNAVVLDIGEGRFAFYAHMQPDSVTVEAGDVVKAGDVIGLLGNSGRTVGPHLHFHVMDHADWRIGDGIPYVFSGFTGLGTLSDDALMMALQGHVIAVETLGVGGSHANQHPLNNQLVGFGQ